MKINVEKERSNETLQWWDT